jgi:PHD/YefM family antitoxin component YafN of YafNO toxin-antitoxin module
MSAILNTIASSELKRKGASAVEERLTKGPVHVIRRNRPVFVALSEEQYAELVSDADRGRIAASLEDVRAGRVRWGTAAALAKELSR